MQHGSLMRSIEKSNRHFQKALTRLPLGVSSNFRYWGEDRTIYVKRGKGGRIWDIDDNEYIDYRLGYGPAILGYADGGTFTGHSVSLSAANKTLEILQRTDALQSIEEYGLRLQTGLSDILTDRGIEHTFVGHPSIMGLFFSEKAPTDYRGWVNTNYDFYDALAPELHELGILVEPDSREPWFMCEAHDVKCRDETLDKFAEAVDITIKKSTAKKAA